MFTREDDGIVVFGVALEGNGTTEFAEVENNGLFFRFENAHFMRDE